MRIIGGGEVNLGSRPAAPSAAWRISPEEAEQLKANPKDGWWQRLFAWLFLAAGAVTIFWIAQTEKSQQELMMTLLKGLVMVVIAEAGLILLLTQQSNDVNLGPGLKRVRAKLPIEDAAPFSVRMYQKGTVTGADEGFMWISEGTLFYKGLQCVFRLNRDDILPLQKWPKRDLPRVEKGTLIKRIHLDIGSREYVLHLRQIDPFEEYGTRRIAHRFQVALSDWLHDRPEGELESVLPPLDVHPNLMHEGPSRKEGVITGGVLVLFNLALAAMARPNLTFGSLESMATVIHLVIALVLCWHSARFAWQQYLDITHRRSVFLENELSGLL